MVCTKFLDQNPIGKKKFFSNFLFQEMSLKRGFFVNFLPQKIYDKIWDCFDIFCNSCVSENFDMSLVSKYAPDWLQDFALLLLLPQCGMIGSWINSFTSLFIYGSPIRISTYPLITSFMSPNANRPIANHSNVLGSLFYIIYKYSNKFDPYCLVVFYPSVTVLFSFPFWFNIVVSSHLTPPIPMILPFFL